MRRQSYLVSSVALLIVVATSCSNSPQRVEKEVRYTETKKVKWGIFVCDELVTHYMDDSISRERVQETCVDRNAARPSNSPSITSGTGSGSPMRTLPPTKNSGPVTVISTSIETVGAGTMSCYRIRTTYYSDGTMSRVPTSC